MSEAYKAALAASDDAIHEYKFMVAAYRTMQINDAEFLTAQKKYKAAMEALDIAFERERLEYMEASV